MQYHQAQDVAELLERLEHNTRRYQSMFAEAADDLMHDPLLFPPAQINSAPRDVFDVMRAQVSFYNSCLFGEGFACLSQIQRECLDNVAIFVSPTLNTARLSILPECDI